MPISNPSVGITARSGNYAGDGTANRAIPHGLGTTPSLVRITHPATNYIYSLHPDIAQIAYVNNANAGMRPVTIMDDVNIYVGELGWVNESANAGGNQYYWVAIG